MIASICDLASVEQGGVVSARLDGLLQHRDEHRVDDLLPLRASPGAGSVCGAFSVSSSAG